MPNFSQPILAHDKNQKTKMKMKNISIFIITLLFISSCNQTEKQKSENQSREQLDNSTANEKVINLDYGFKITFLENEEFTDNKIYWNTKIFFDSQVVFTDTKTLFEIKDNYPRIRKIGNKFEILFYENDSPSIDKIRMLIFSNGYLEKNERLPLFGMKPIDIDNDGVKELIGLLNASELWGDDTIYMPYNPILVYEFNENGILIDSSETIKINSDIYGSFYGFRYDSEIKFVNNENFYEALDKYK